MTSANHTGRKIIQVNSFKVNYLGYLLVDKEVDIMTTKDKNKKDILDKVKEILNKKESDKQKS
ncbi:hypothetical protein ACUXJ9_000361 [Staphylococcus caledonicus]